MNRTMNRMPNKSVKQMNSNQQKRRVINHSGPPPLFRIDKRKAEGGTSNFKHFHIFYNHKSYTPKDWMPIKQNHRVHIFLSTIYDLTIPEKLPQFIARCASITRRKTIIHIPAKSPDKVKLLNELMLIKSDHSIASLSKYWKIYIQNGPVWFHVDGFKGDCLVMKYNENDNIWYKDYTNWDNINKPKKKEEN